MTRNNLKLTSKRVTESQVQWWPVIASFHPSYITRVNKEDNPLTSANYNYKYSFISKLPATAIVHQYHQILYS
ncbi:hypothetical protein SFRURICE_015954, partial [Spodoptera frugiperda]